MSPERPLAALFVAALVVWAVAFGGGYTIAVLTSSANVSVTFETNETFETDLPPAPPERAVAAAAAVPNGADAVGKPAGSNESDDGNESAGFNESAEFNESDGLNEPEGINESDDGNESDVGNESDDLDAGEPEPSDPVENGTAEDAGGDGGEAERTTDAGPSNDEETTGTDEETTGSDEETTGTDDDPADDGSGDDTAPGGDDADGDAPEQSSDDA